MAGFRSLLKNILGVPPADPHTGERHYFWGGDHLSFQEAREHFLAVGSSGSGKTILIRLLLQSVVNRIGNGKSRVRAVVYDEKTEFLGWLHGMRKKNPFEIVSLNPLDRRGYAWNLAEDIQTPAQIDELAVMLCPEKSHSSQPFFQENARLYVKSVIESFYFCTRNHETDKVRWDLRDVLLAFDSKDNLRAVLGNHPNPRGDLIEQLEVTHETFQSVKSTAFTELDRYRVIASAWHHVASESGGRRLYSLKRWRDSEDVLVLGSHKDFRQIMVAINRLMFGYLEKQINRVGEEVHEDETWVFVDELREAGRLEGLRELAQIGRSKGCALVLGFQDINGVKEVYKTEWSDIIGNIRNHAFLNLNRTSIDTAQYCEKAIGRTEIGGHARLPDMLREELLYRVDEKGEHVPVQPQKIEYRYFFDLPKTNAANGLTAIFGTERSGTVKRTIPADWLFGSEALIARPPNIANFEEINADRQWLLPWTPEDRSRLGIAQEPGSGPGPLRNVGETETLSPKEYFVKRGL